MSNRTCALVLLALSVCSPAHSAQVEQLWLYYSTNLQVNANVDRLEPIWRRAAKAGYTHVLLADSKMAKLDDLGGMENVYQANVQRVRKLATELNLQVVPAVFHIGYSNAMLWHDPNLAEGLPVKRAFFVVKNGEARLVADPPVAFNPKPDWKDQNVQIDGGTATVRDPAGNARFTYKLNVSPFRCYHVSVMVRTDGFTGEPRVAAIGDKGSLQYTNLGVKGTQDWREHHIVFNSLDHQTVNVYFGVWGSAKGTLQWKDWSIEEAGLTNVLRRPGAPVVVEGYAEGTDYEPIRDPRLGNTPWKGSYEVWHEPPAIRTKLPDGTKLRVSWYHPAIIYDGQVSACPCEPKTLKLLEEEAKLVRAAWQPKGLMMSHDEIRTMGWDESCVRRNLDAGQILAENVRFCTGLLKGSDVYVWSDMLDPHHNAVKDYYLVRGDLAGSWEGLDKGVVIINWNFGKRDQSLKFFADRGHRQIVAGYYDSKPAQVKEWLASAGKVEGVVGAMYTTWRNQYDGIEEFARYCR